MKYAIGIHGGAGDLPFWGMDKRREEEHISALKECLDLGYKILESGGTALDAVEGSVAALEDHPLFNAGKGSSINREGQVEMDAAIMCGKTLRAGAATAVRGVKNPIILARGILEKCEHLFLTSEGAEEFAREIGIITVPDEYFITDERFAMWQDKQKSSRTNELDGTGTAGAVALDSNGDLAAATSTGGLVNKRRGRVADTAIIGAGTYANNETCAVTCTGTGEYIIRTVTAHEISSMLKYKEMDLSDACEHMLQVRLNPLGGQFGLMAIDTSGYIKTVFNTQRMYRAWQKSDGDHGILLY